jgi:transposase
VLAALVVSLRRELAEARERIAEFEDQLRKTSRNSSVPPSADGLAKPPPRSRSLRKKTGRKPGGQDGHPGRTLAQVARADREVRHEPACCGRCGAGLAGRPVTGVERRQVFDLPPVKVKVTEHQLIERESAAAGIAPRAPPRRGADAPVQYGPRIAAVIIYLYIGQFLSKKRTAQALAELFGIPLSAETVAGITAQAAGRLDGFLERVREDITASPVAGFDETGFRVEGRLAWVHCARTGKYTLLMVHPRRGKKAMEAMGILPSFAGVAVHDAWGPYDTYSSPNHQLCCAHYADTAVMPIRRRLPLVMGVPGVRISALSQGFEKGQELVWRPVTAGRSAERGGAVQRLFLERHVCGKVDMSGPDRFVTFSGVRIVHRRR